MSHWSWRAIFRQKGRYYDVSSRNGRHQTIGSKTWRLLILLALLYGLFLAVFLSPFTFAAHLTITTNVVYDARFLHLGDYRGVLSLRQAEDELLWEQRRLKRDAGAGASAEMRQNKQWVSGKAPPFPYYTIVNKRACADANIDVVICVHTHPLHRKARDVIRRTWGNQQHWRFHRVRTLFFAGMPTNDSAAQTALEMESDVFGDIVQGEFDDTYRNLTIKALAVMRWVRSYCSHATHFIKIDDDVILNVFSVQELFTPADQFASSSKSRNNDVNSSLASSASFAKFTRVKYLNDGEIACIAFQNITVKRQGKWAVTEDELSPEHKVYPQFCAGMGYYMRTSTALRLHDVVDQVPFFWIDDIYVSGFLANRINATFVPFNERIVWNEKDILYFVGKRWRTYYMAHIKSKKVSLVAWDKLVKLGFGLLNNSIIDMTTRAAVPL